MGRALGSRMSLSRPALFTNGRAPPCLWACHRLSEPDVRAAPRGLSTQGVRAARCRTLAERNVLWRRSAAEYQSPGRPPAGRHRKLRCRPSGGCPSGGRFSPGASAARRHADAHREHNYRGACLPTALRPQGRPILCRYSALLAKRGRRCSSVCPDARSSGTSSRTLVGGAGSTCQARSHAHHLHEPFARRTRAHARCLYAFVGEGVVRRALVNRAAGKGVHRWDLAM